MENKYFMIVAVLCFFCFLLYKEIKRTNKDRLFFRILAIFLALLALLFLSVPLTYTVNKTHGKHELILLTAGATLKLKSDRYFTSDSLVLRSYGQKQVTYLPDLAYYLQAHPAINRLKVYGYGLTATELDALSDYRIDFYPAVSAAGITAVSWPRAIKENELLRIEGMYNHTSSVPVKLLLEGLGTRLDSVLVNAGGLVPFNLNARPKLQGRAVYQLSVVQGTDTLQKESIPFRVGPVEKTKVLVLSSFPDFEYKFLKNWLYENQYQVVFRTRVSKDKFSEDQLNTQGVNTSVINSSLLQQFDLVIADDEELSGLDGATSASLRAAIGNGLGLFIRLDEAKALSVFARAFRIEVATDSNVRSVSPVLVETGHRLNPLLVTQPFYLQENRDAALLVKNQSDKILLSTHLYGSGKITASVMTDTYNWVLTNEKRDYAGFWSHVIGQTVRKQELNSRFTTVPDLPVADQQLAILFETEGADSIPKFTVNNSKTSPLQHAVFPFSWKTTYWPKHTGWNEVSIPSSKTDYFYVHVPSAWNTLKMEERLQKNLAHPKKPALASGNTDGSLETTTKEIAKWWFLLLFLVAAAYLWFETKLL